MCVCECVFVCANRQENRIAAKKTAALVGYKNVVDRRKSLGLACTEIHFQTYKTTVVFQVFSGNTRLLDGFFLVHN